MNLPIYLDYNATTPIAPEVLAAMLPWLTEHFGNPSSAHIFGQRAAAAVSTARLEVANLIGATAEEIVFTGCATEANNLAILGVARALAGKKRHLVISAIEHPAVMAPALRLQDEGWSLTVVPVDDFGRVDPLAVAAALRPDTALVSIMHANNEVGTVQPIAEIAKLVKDAGVLLHVDAAQSAGKLPVDVNYLSVDLLTLAGHKFYAPKGVGALYVRAGTTIASLLAGADQERGLRPGTESVPLIVAFGAAARLAKERQEKGTHRLTKLRDRLHELLRKDIAGLQLNGHPDFRLPNTLHISFPGVSGKALLAACADEVAASVGSACHAHGDAVSGVLAAMGCDKAKAVGAVRLSVGWNTSTAEVDRAAAALIRGHRQLLAMNLPMAEHWESVYRSKPGEAMSWYRTRLDRSLYWIETLLGNQRNASIIDVGAGESTLVDNLLVDGFSNLTLVDLSATALTRVQQRLGDGRKNVAYHIGDITRLKIPGASFRLWHDRAVFHFLTSPPERQRYVEQAAASIEPGGYAIIATFADDGPRQCSQLEVSNYDAATLAAVFGDAFERVADERESHVTPSGKTQAFQYVVLKRRS